MFKNFKITTKLIISFMLVGLLPFFFMGGISYIKSSTSLREQSFSQLKSIREIKKKEVINYLALLKNQIQSSRNNEMIIESMENFSKFYNNIDKELNLNSSNIDKYKKELETYYKGDFNNKYNEINKKSSEYQKYFNKLGEKAIILQYLYIHQNNNPLGNKDLLDYSKDKTNYSKQHRLVHPFIRDYLNKFGYYDIFLIDIDTGNVVYSVYKELDYATSLINGPYTNSGLAKAFNAAKLINNKDSIAMVDFKIYYPSYEAPAGFIAAPIFKGDKKIGVIAFQFPIGKLNEIMQEREGMGKTGETYLVGSDKLMRSDSFLDPINHSVISSFKNPQKGSVDTEAVNEGISKKSGEKIIIDYNGNEVLSAYTPIEFNGLHWILLAEIDKKEVFASIDEFFIIFITTTIVGSAIILAVALLISRGLSKPLHNLSDKMKDVAQGEADLTNKIDVRTNDEIGDVSNYFNEFLEKLLHIVLDVKKSAVTIQDDTILMTKSMDNLVKGEKSNYHNELTHKVDEGLNHLEEHIKEAMDKVRNQTASAEQVMASIEEISSTLNLTSNNVDSIAGNSEKSVELSNLGYGKISDVNTEIKHISTSVDHSSKEIESLLNLSHEIGNITVSINSISEQTNLLALNAAIEAARAGDAGRGFAVVAEAIRKLAEETNEETEKIKSLISNIQVGISTVKKSNDEVNNNVDLAMNVMEETQEKIKDVIGLVEQNNKEIGDIKSSVKEQTYAIHEITEAIQAITNDSTEIEGVSIKNDEIAKNLKKILNDKLENLNELAELTDKLVANISGFKTEK